jgi:oxalate decarboxylase
MAHTYKFDSSKPVEIPGGELQQGFRRHLAELEGISIQSVKLEAGAVQAPHFHPNASQLDYCISGKARLGIIEPESVDQPKTRKRVIEMDAGDISFVRKGNVHWFENIGNGPLHYLVVFTSEEPIHVDVHEIVALIPNHVFAKMWGVSEETLSGIPQQD